MCLQGCLSASDVGSDYETDGEEAAFPNHNPDEYECFIHNDWERCYITHIPDSVTQDSNAPLIVEPVSYTHLRAHET